MMDLAGQELHVFASISSAAGTRNRAKALISLAESNPDHADTLAACATVLLAAAENGRVKVNIKQSLNPWGSVKLERAKTYEAAVGAYFSEVIFPESGQMKNGIIITARRY